MDNKLLPKQIPKYISTDFLAQDQVTAPTTAAPVAPELGLLVALLNMVDHGMAVVHADTGQLVYANRLAQAALHPASTQPTGLTLSSGRVCTRQRQHEPELALALLRAKTQLRSLLNVVAGASDSAVAVVPLNMAAGAAKEASVETPNAALPPEQTAEQHDTQSDTQCDAVSYAVLVFTKERQCDTTSITLFAHQKGLTGAEGQVLARVCEGMRPQQIAVRQGVQISTVRTQLRSIRQKTASDSVRELIEMVSVLPPLARHMQQFFEPQQVSGAAFG